MERYIPLQYYTRTEVHADKARKNKSAVSCTYRRNQHNLLQYVFSFKRNDQKLLLQKSKKVKEALMQFIAVSILTSVPVDSILEVAKVSNQTLVMLTEVLRLIIFIFFIFGYATHVILCMRRQSNSCIYEACRYL